MHYGQLENWTDRVVYQVFYTLQLTLLCFIIKQLTSEQTEVENKTVQKRILSYGESCFILDSDDLKCTNFEKLKKTNISRLLHIYGNQH